MKNKLALPLAAAVLVVSAGTGFVAIANADTLPAPTTSSTTQQPQRQKPAAMGAITAISGTNITIEDKQAGTTYTIDASSATITKHAKPATQGAAPTSTTISASDLAVGDMVVVQGTVSGTTVTATSIETGRGGGPGGMRGPRGVFGTVASVSGSTITVTGKDGKTYTVDATSAKASKVETINVSDIQVGDTVGVDGALSGTSVTATHIMDGAMGGPQGK